jgi:integrase
MGVTVREKPKGSGCWWVFIHHAGQRRAHRVGPGKRGKQLAEAVAIKIRARLLEGDVSDLARRASGHSRVAVMTFADLAADWQTWYPGLHAIRATTMDNHESVLRAHLLPFFGALPVRDITVDTVERFIAAKRALGGSLRRGGKPLADSSLRVVLATLQLILDRAVRRGMLSANPVPLADWRGMPRIEQIDPFTPAELRRILAAADLLNREIGTLLRLWMQAGLREGEVLALRTNDLDLQAGTVVVDETYSKRRLGPPKTGATRTVSILHPTTEDILGWEPGSTAESHEILTRLRSRPVAALDPRAFLFGGGDRPMNRERLSWWWHRALVRAGVRYRYPEQLRHTWASILLSRNAPVLYIGQQGGWRSAGVLFKHYARWMPQQPAATSAQPPSRARLRSME